NRSGHSAPGVPLSSAQEPATQPRIHPRLNAQPALSMNTRLTRRSFLKTAALAAGAAVVPTLIPASALGREGAVAPSERIGMGFIGLGGQGTGHLLGGACTYVPGGYVARDDVQVKAVCDV